MAANDLGLAMWWQLKNVLTELLLMIAILLKIYS
jgi:hypothetical protein